jgi:hypothetical protein
MPPHLIDAEHIDLDVEQVIAGQLRIGLEPLELGDKTG